MKTIQDMQSLGRAIRDRRRELGYTQAFLADYAGISASFLSELENGKETIQAGKMMEVISLLGLSKKNTCLCSWSWLGWACGELWQGPVEASPCLPVSSR